MGFVIIEEQTLTVAVWVKWASLSRVLDDDVNVWITYYSRKGKQRGGIERNSVAGLLSQ